ncbi:MAG: hypothetical protein WC840_05105 [Candidatus Peribacteraceae bacterium]
MTSYPDRFAPHLPPEDVRVEKIGDRTITELGSGFSVLKPIPVEIIEEIPETEDGVRPEGNIVASVRRSLGLLVVGRGRTAEEAVQQLIVNFRVQCSFLEKAPLATPAAKAAYGRLREYVKKNGPAPYRCQSKDEWHEHLRSRQASSAAESRRRRGSRYMGG